MLCCKSKSALHLSTRSAQEGIQSPTVKENLVRQEGKCISCSWMAGWQFWSMIRGPTAASPASAAFLFIFFKLFFTQTLSPCLRLVVNTDTVSHRFHAMHTRKTPFTFHASLSRLCRQSRSSVTDWVSLAARCSLSLTVTLHNTPFFLRKGEFLLHPPDSGWLSPLDHGYELVLHRYYSYMLGKNNNSFIEMSKSFLIQKIIFIY